jgi:membrane protein required for colicin V production
MNLFDIVILVILFFFALKGLFRGLVNEAASLAGLILGGWLAYRYHPLLAAPIQDMLHTPAHVSAFLAFVALLILTGLIAHILGNIITAALRAVMLGSLNRLGGLLLGAVEGALLLSMIFCIATADFMPLSLKQKIQSSESAAMFAGLGSALLSAWREKPDAAP